MNTFTPMTREEGRARRKNSVLIGSVLFVLVALFYAVTIVKLQGNVAKRMGMGMKSTAGQQTAQSVTSSAAKINSAKTAQDK